MKRSDPDRRGGDAWAFAGPDGVTPLTPHLGWLWFETRELRKWVRHNWSPLDEMLRQKRAGEPS